jgi:hypothetical protein
MGGVQPDTSNNKKTGKSSLVHDLMLASSQYLSEFQPDLIAV